MTAVVYNRRAKRGTSAVGDLSTYVTSEPVPTIVNLVAPYTWTTSVTFYVLLPFRACQLILSRGLQAATRRVAS